MAAANLTPRRRRTIILATPLAELDGAALVIDCLTPDWCTGCQRRVGVAWLVAGPGTGQQRREVRVTLVGPDAVG